MEQETLVELFDVDDSRVADIEDEDGIDLSDPSSDKKGAKDSLSFPTLGGDDEGTPQL